MKIIFILSSLLSFNFAHASPDIQCWGNNTDQQLTVPDTVVGDRLVGTAVSVLTFDNSTCVLNSKAQLKCWGKSTASTKAIEALTDVTSLVAGESDAGGVTANCALTTTGYQCDGTGDSNVLASTSTSVVAGLHDACGIDKGIVSCIGTRADFQIPKLKNPKKIALISHDLCFLDDSGVACVDDGTSDFNISNQVPKLSQPTDLFMTYGYACAVDKTGVHCWGNPDNDNLPPIPTIPASKVPIHYVAGRSHICGLTKDGVQCWGDNQLGQLEVPPLKNPKSIISNYSSNQTCAIDDTGVVCWGDDRLGQSSLTAYTAISAGLGNTCALVHGKIKCWGMGSAKLNQGIQDSETTKDLTSISQIGLGPNFACVVDSVSNSPNSCFGDNDSMVLSSPALPYDIQAVSFLSVGFSHVCYSSDASVNCFGSNEFGQSTPPKDLKLKIAAKSFASGGHHTCAIDSLMGLRCWGSNVDGQLNIPTGLKNPRNLTAGYNHTCVLDDVGVHCWGSHQEGQTKVPPLKNPKLVEAGGYHTCALDDDGVHCWGDNSFGQLNVPKTLGKNTTQLSTGYLHSCAVVK